MFKYSVFTFCEKVPRGVLLRNTFTRAVVLLNPKTKQILDEWLQKDGTIPSCVNRLIDQGILVEDTLDEMIEWKSHFLKEIDVQTFRLIFEPTLQCQFRCPYCFEHGADRGRMMNAETVEQTKTWMNEYFSLYPEISKLSVRLFGGEPLLGKKILAKMLDTLRALCFCRKIEFCCDVTTNGELLNDDMIRFLSTYNCQDVQITLDGPADIHDKRRCGKGGRPTYATIMENIKKVLATDLIPRVIVRMTFDNGTKDRMIELVDDLDKLHHHDRIVLSLGLTSPTFLNVPESLDIEEFASKAINIWKYAKEKGFKIPDEFIAGPRCLASAKHQVVLQPNGALQKCICTNGRKEFDVGHVSDIPTRHIKDMRYEHWERIDDCVQEQCIYLPVCGGGCMFSAMAIHGTGDGASQRYCEKKMFDLMNRGLLRLTYS